MKTINKLNKFKHEDCTTILYVSKKGKTYEVLIDRSDFDKIQKYKWILNSKNYVISSVKSEQILLHRVIMDAPKTKYVDHINHDTLDNRRRNLRLCTQSENMRNARLNRNNVSGYPGVYWHNQNNKWIAKIKKDYKSIYLGSFDDKNDAIKARKDAEVKYFGEFRYKGKINKEVI